MSKAFSTFYDSILPELRGCTTGMVNLHLVHVAREICDRTGCWWDQFPDVSVEPGVTVYYLTVPEQRAELVRVRELRIGGELQWRYFDPPPAIARSRPVVTVERPRFAVNTPPFSISQDRSQIILDEVPGGDLSIAGSMRPTLVATSLPDVLRDQLLDVVRLGVLSRLMRMGNKPWTDRDLSVAYGHDYDVAIDRTANDVAQTNTRSMLRTRASAL